MYSRVSVGRIDPDAISEVCRICAEFDTDVAPEISGLKRRQLYVYYDLAIHVQDFLGEEVSDAAAAEADRDPRGRKLGGDLSRHITPYGSGVSDDHATAFYRWDGGPSIDKADGLHSTVIVNRIEDSAIPEVARLFRDLDRTDFPYQMGTRRRQLLSFHGVYFHIQDFELQNGNAVINQAWKDADPRFLKICRDLEPLVQKYAPEKWRSIDDQIGVRYYYWEASV